MSPSPIRCRGPWKVHKRSSEPDRWLDEMGFFRKHTARDSSCLFRAVSENIFNTQRYFHKVRLDCVQFMASHCHLFEGSLSCPFDNYLKEMSNPSEWGGPIEISAMSHLYRQDFVIFEANKGPQTKICNGYGNTIYLFYCPDTKHFDAVYTKDFIHASSFCQSLVYEILYDGVYQLKDLPYAVDKMLHDKVPANHIEYLMSENVERRKKQKERAKIFIEAPSEDDKDRNNNALALKCKHHTEDLERASLLKESLSIFVFNRSLIQLENVCMNCLNVNSAKDLLDNGITPFPYKVAKALDPDIYRNIEFDVWSELRRELRYGARYCDGTTLQVGVKCLCKLEPDQSVPYHCHIQEMRPDGPCLVFIEELGEKRIVSYEQLEPLPVEQIKPWAPPYRYSRTNSQILNLSQMLQQIGNITRKQSLKSRKKEDQKESDNNQKLSKLDKQEKCQDLPLYTQNVYTYPHLDYLNFQPMPVEVKTLPLMVDCRPAGAPPHEMTHNNGAPDNQHQRYNENDTRRRTPIYSVSFQQTAAGDPAPHARAPTPAAAAYQHAYNGAMTPAPPGVPYCAPYPCGVKSLVWCAPPAPHAPPPPPPGVNPHVYRSLQPSGADLPMNDVATLRFYFNVGVECMWAAYGAPAPPAPGPPAAPPGPAPAPAPGPAPPPPAHRHYSPRELAQDMAAASLDHKKDRPPPLKGNPQRPLLGPRFKRNNNQDGNQNKGHNGGAPNKGPNNRRGSHADGRAQYAGAAPDDCAEPPVAFPYLYPPPLYSVPYYPIDSDSAMMGMMSGMGYVPYEDGVEYAPVQPFYPPHFAPHPHAPHVQHLQHAPHAPHAPHGPHAPHAPHAAPPHAPHTPHTHHQDHK